MHLEVLYEILADATWIELDFYEHTAHSGMGPLAWAELAAKLGMEALTAADRRLVAEVAVETLQYRAEQGC